MLYRNPLSPSYTRNEEAARSSGRMVIVYQTMWRHLHLSTSRSSFLLLLQSKIAQLISSFQHKQKRQTDVGRFFYLKEHYNVTMGLYPIPKQQKTEEYPSLLKHTFLKTVRTFHQFLINMCDTDSYWHSECYVICIICSLFHEHSYSTLN